MAWAFFQPEIVSTTQDAISPCISPYPFPIATCSLKLINEEQKRIHSITDESDLCWSESVSWLVLPSKLQLLNEGFRRISSAVRDHPAHESRVKVLSQHGTLICQLLQHSSAASGQSQMLQRRLTSVSIAQQKKSFPDLVRDHTVPCCYLE